MVQAADFAKTLQLTVLSPSTQTEWDIRTTDLNRPGMQFCGFYEYFPFERPQVIGKVEMTYLENLEPEVRRQMLKSTSPSTFPASSSAAGCIRRKSCWKPPPRAISPSIRPEW